MLFLAARLPTDQFGALNIALTILIAADTVADLGLSRLTVWTMSRQKDPALDYPGGLIPLRILLALVAYGVCAFSIVSGAHGPDVAAFVFIIGAGLLVTGVASILESILQARSMFAFIGAAHAGLSVVQAGTGALAVMSGGGTVALATTFLFSNLTYLLLLLAAVLVKLGMIPLRIDPAFWRTQLRSALPYAGTAIVLIFSMRCELLIMSWASTPGQVAYFSVAARLNDAAILGPIVLSTILVPIYSRRFHEAPADMHQAYAPVLRWGLVCAVPAAALGCVFIEPVLSYFLPAYIASAGLARIMFIAMPAFAVCQLNHAVLLSSDRQGRTMFVLTGLTLLQFLFGFVFIIPYAADGAAYSYAIWALAAAVISTALTHTWHLRQMSLFDALAPVVAASIATSAMLWMVWDLGLVIRFCTGLAIYPIAVWLTVRSLRQSRRAPDLA